MAHQLITNAFRALEGFMAISPKIWIQRETLISNCKEAAFALLHRSFGMTQCLCTRGICED